MEKKNNNNLTKKEISKFISKKIGLSNHYIDIVVEDLIVLLKETIMGGKLHVLNFGSFKKDVCNVNKINNIFIFNFFFKLCFF